MQEKVKNLCPIFLSGEIFCGNFLIPDHGKLWHKWPSFLGSCNRTNKPILVPIIAKTIFDKLILNKQMHIHFYHGWLCEEKCGQIYIEEEKMSQRKNFLWQSSNGYLPHILAAHNIFLLPHQYFASNILTNIWYCQNILAAQNIFLLLHKDCAGNILAVHNAHVSLSTFTSIFETLTQYLPHICLPTTPINCYINI